MNRIKSRWWLFRIRREYRKGLGLLNRCEPGSELQARMARNLKTLIAVIADAEDEYYHTGQIRGIRA